jgi:hypothetical protein
VGGFHLFGIVVLVNGREVVGWKFQWKWVEKVGV